MAYIDKIVIDGTQYEIQDAEATEDIAELESNLDALGLSVVNGRLNITYEEA